MGRGIKMELANIKVNHEKGSYEVVIQDSFSGLKKHLEQIPNISSIFVITERTISQLYIKYLEKELANLNIPIHVLFIKGGEKNKHIDRLRKVYNSLIENHVDRKSLILALGGGVVGDFAGFIASTILRGIRFVQIPTTLLACVDSSVGGKVAVNVDKGKNMIGSFYQPELVYVPLFTLKTLPQKEWRCGLAEIAKHSLLSGGKMWEDFKNHSRLDIYPESAVLVRMIQDSIEFKSSIVSQDEKETGLRQILNLGHTTAHAIESLTEYRKYSHGEAVSIGLVTAILLSKELVGFPEENISMVISALKNYNLPTHTKLKAKDLLEHMLHDKKKVGNELRFVLLENIGKPIYNIPISKNSFSKVWKLQQKL